MQFSFGYQCELHPLFYHPLVPYLDLSANRHSSLFSCFFFIARLEILLIGQSVARVTQQIVERVRVYVQESGHVYARFAATSVERR